MLRFLMGVMSILSMDMFAFASVTDCSNGKSAISLQSMSFSPDPTVPGENSTLLLSMIVPKVITYGTVSYTTTYNFIPFSPTIEPLCTTTLPCPIQVGELKTVSSFPVDPTLSGTLSIKVEWTDGNALQLLCILIKTKLG